MKTMSIFYFAYLLIIFTPVCYALSGADLQLLYKYRYGGKQSAKALVDGLEDRAAGIIFLRNAIESKSSASGNLEINYADARVLLRNLGDRENLKAVYDKFLTAPSAYERIRCTTADFPYITHPELIVVVGADLDKVAGKVLLQADTQEAFEVPYFNAYTILRIITSSGFFTDDVVTWANSINSKYDWSRPYLYLEEIRAFWALNREKLEAGQYQLVRPPGVVPAPTPVPSAPKVVESSALPSRMPDAPRDQPVARLPEDRPGGSTWIWWIAGAALILASWLLIKTKR